MKIQIPSNCPCCEHPLERINDQLFCHNKSCPAQLNKKVEHFAKTLGIKGLGEKTIEKLNLSDLTELYYLDRTEVIESLGSEKVADKLLNEIEKSKTAPLSKVLASFSIPLIGNTAGTKLAGIVRKIEDIAPEQCKLAGLGDKATSNLMDWIETEYVEIAEFLPFQYNVEEKTPNSTGETVCITGKLKSFKTKAEAYEHLINAGFTVVESVTKTLNYLVDEEDKSSSKRQKAESYGITIITNLLDFIQGKKHD